MKNPLSMAAVSDAPPADRLIDNVEPIVIIMERYGVTITITAISITIICILFIYALKIWDIRVKNDLKSDRDRQTKELEIMNRERESAMSINVQMADFVTKVQPQQLSSLERISINLYNIDKHIEGICTTMTTTDNNIAVIENNIEHLRENVNRITETVNSLKIIADSESKYNRRLAQMVEKLQQDTEKIYTLIRNKSIG